MRKIEDIENFFEHDFEKDELIEVIENLENKYDFFEKRKFIFNMFSGERNTNFKDYDVVALSLLEKQVDNCVLNLEITTPHNTVNKYCHDNKEVIKKLSYDVYCGDYSSYSDLKQFISVMYFDTHSKNDDLVTLEKSNLKQLTNIIDKERYYCNNDVIYTKEVDEYLKDFKSLRTAKINELIPKEVATMISLNKSSSEIKTFLNKMQTYSTIKIPEFISKETTSQNFESQLKQTLKFINSSSYEGMTTSSAFLINNMKEEEKQKLNKKLLKKGCVDKNSFELYLTKVINEKKQTKHKEENRGR